MPRTRKSCASSAAPSRGSAHGRDDAAHHVVDREADLLRRQQDGLRQAVIRSRPRTSAWFSSSIAIAEPIATLTSSAVRSPDGDAVLASHVALDRRVDVEAADAHRLERDDARRG
jgi:hypothetical protein